MDIRTLHETGDVDTLDHLRELQDSASTRVEREVVQLTIELLDPSPRLALASLRFLVDEYLPWLERRNVHRARNAGVSWAGIARLLGRSRQSVHERFARPITVAESLPPPPLRRIDAHATDRAEAARYGRRVDEADRADLDGGLVPW